MIPKSTAIIGDSAFGFCDSLTIYCEVSHKPNGWDEYWNPDDRPVVWGDADPPMVEQRLEYSLKDDGTYEVVGIGTYTDPAVVIPAEVDGIAVTSIGNSAFYGCTGFTSITIPNSVISIGYNAFRDCEGLTSVSIPNSVTTIGSQVFSGCTCLTSVTIGSGVTNITTKLFWLCNELTSITVAEGNAKYHATGNCLIETASKTLVLGCKSSVIPTDGSVTSIGDYAFGGCNGLTDITICSYITNIGKEAFMHSGLTSIIIPDSITSINENVFYGCSRLTSIQIGSCVTSIDKEAFYGCSELTSITVAEGNTKYHVTDNCLIETASKTLVLGCKSSVIPTDGSVTSIGNYAFGGCNILTSYTIPNGIKSIGNSAFSGCSGLTSITIPDSVTSIGDYVFYNCRGLTSITFNGTKAQWNAILEGYLWNRYVPATYVQCSDGQVSLQ